MIKQYWLYFIEINDKSNSYKNDKSFKMFLEIFLA